MEKMTINHHGNNISKISQLPMMIVQSIHKYLASNPATKKIEFVVYDQIAIAKVRKAQEIVKLLTFSPHSVHCVPTRCNCYLKHINELREVLK